MNRRGMPRAPDCPCSGNGAHAAAGQDESEVTGRAVVGVLHYVRQQDLGGPDEEQVGGGGGGKSRAQPGVRCDIPQPAHGFRPRPRPTAAGVPRYRIAPTQAIETRNVAASRAKAAEAPTAATSIPPNAGPAIRSARGLTTWSTAFAWSSSPGGTRSGTTESNAGPKKPVAAPYTVTQTNNGHVGSLWLSDVAVSPSSAAHRTRALASGTLRHRRWSATSPPTSSSASCGAVSAIATAANADVVPATAYTCSTPSPSSEMPLPAYSSAESR